ncbi:MAG: hypothetical protein IJH43_01400 [Mogibacterium sp.]|nr:hypothetical protein [Mogibacterium sp.]
MENLTERDKQAVELSKEIITLARNSIIVNLRFMDRAVGNFRCVPNMNYGFAGGSGYVIYSPWTLINTYRLEQNLIARDLLHSILHSVFRHNITGDGIDRLKWDLAADIAVEDSINSLGRDFLRVRRQARQEEITERLRDDLTYLTAERVYHYLNSGKVSATKCYEWSELFAGDQHDLWYGLGPSDHVVTSDIDLKELWEDISRRMQTELELFSDNKGALTQNLRSVNRVRYNYTEFLRRFGIHSETMKLSEEEFDNNYYTYGMELYGDIPLIEPLEYKDNRNIRDFVIAIDTSGSVQGEIVQKFVQHTHDVLSASKSFHETTNLYIIQCDDEIRDVEVIRNQNDFDRYFSTKEIKGLGRTDFRPVFKYVDKLLEERKLTDLRGLLYFTDGKGKFPEIAPAYDVAFIIHNDSMNDIWVPDWAAKIEMQAEEIMNL